jgi:hypothetical protein
MQNSFPAPTELLVRRLYDLACMPRDLDSWKARWGEYQWDQDSLEVDPSRIQVSLPEGWILQLFGEDGTLLGASLPFYYWENYEPEFHDDPLEFAREKRLYDARFDGTAELALRSLPEPLLRWTDKDQDAHRAIAWAGTHGILILQQACVDPQFGIEVNFWIADCPSSEFRPETPLIDWLMRRDWSI